LDESVEQEEEIVIEPVAETTPEKVADPSVNEGEADAEKAIEFPPEEAPPALVPAIQDLDTKPVITRLAFNDVDEAFGGETGREEIIAPKNIERLEEISAARNMQRKLEEDGEDDDAPLDRIRINDVPLDLGELGITNLDGDGGSDDLKLDFEEIM
jgi:hypothetical protein